MATQASEKVERLLNLVICLLHTRRPLLKEQIRRAVPQYDQESDEAFDRMFERDKDELRTLGIPLRSRVDVVFEDDTGYFIDRSEYALPQIEFTPAEAAALSLAARTWTHAALAGSGAEALRKLTAAGVDTDGAASSPTLGVEPRVRAVEPAFDAVHAAVVATQPIAFDYRRSGAPASRRHVLPWGIASWHGRWYLTGYDTDRQDSRVFRLGRIEGKVVRDGRPGSYEVPADHDARSAVRFSAGSRESSGVAQLLVRAGRAHALRRRAIPDTLADPGAGASDAAESVEDLGDPQRDETWDRISVAYDDTGRFVDELCSYGADVVALEPAPVRSAVIDRLRAAAQMAPAGSAGTGAGEAS
ncbi:proteasome accessory factor B [Kineosphaera limosa]|uniref:Proteasome accessory factor B n=1 Tax=Kineosphaera limosa NBRC 100340 TaxID=1184609 RepID=K6VEC3_9MICO|nr:WYL domain-containing protein [Kineosphaera limosa]NYE03221.1 proteasome accessory factor B [Kineosphaera limosa]GAB94558.1 proteasome accessory factor B [Kineosphaera limosa NBRC 100340]